jgi:hypothetical protein
MSAVVLSNLAENEDLQEKIRKVRDTLKEYGVEVAVTSVGAGVVLMGLYGSALVANALILAVTTTTGIILIAYKLPRAMQKALVKHGLFTDMAAAVGTYYVLGASVTSLMAAAFVGVFTSVILWVAKPVFEEEAEKQSVLVSIEEA